MEDLLQTPSDLLLQWPGKFDPSQCEWSCKEEYKYIYNQLRFATYLRFGKPNSSSNDHTRHDNFCRLPEIQEDGVGSNPTRTQPLLFHRLPKHPLYSGENRFGQQDAVDPVAISLSRDVEYSESPSFSKQQFPEKEPLSCCHSTTHPVRAPIFSRQCSLLSTN